MPSVSDRTFSLPEKLSAAIQELTSQATAKEIAQAVLKMSDFYNQNPSAQTPWSEKWCKLAQVAYFLPLNYLRSLAIQTEAKKVSFPLGKLPLIDFGSGIGAGHLAWMPQDLSLIERSSAATELNQKILQILGHQKAKISSEKEVPKDGQFTALFSYSLTELSTLPAWAWNAENLILIEPSTRDDGRKLLEIRQQLIAQGFSIWAPCPHQADCPLLTKSKADWCHDRIHLEMPNWFLEIEKNLPMKNRTVTFSYLLASRTPAPATNQWRLVGDRLDEKGKSRQLVCRNSEREFLAWMHRNGEPPEWPRGVLIDPPARFEQKNNELRLK